VGRLRPKCSITFFNCRFSVKENTKRRRKIRNTK